MPVDKFLDEGMIGFIENTAREKLWGIGEWYSLEDLIQDGYMCYYKCYNRYRNLTVKQHPSIDDKRRFMKLVKTAFLNHITTLSVKRMRLHEQPASQLHRADQTLEAYWDGVLQAQPEAGTAAALFAKAPKELQQLVQLLTSDGAAGLQYLRQRRGNRVRLVRGGPHGWKQLLPRETTNEYCCRLLGLDPKQVNIVEQMRSYLVE